MTDELVIYISKSSVYRILKQRDLISELNRISISTEDELHKNNISISFRFTYIIFKQKKFLDCEDEKFRLK